MNTYRKQSRRPKPVPANKVLERFRREMAELGFDVFIDYGSGNYQPNVTVSAWKREEETRT